MQYSYSNWTYSPQGKGSSRNQYDGSWGYWYNVGSPFWVSYDVRSASGVETPDFHKRKRSGELLPLNLYVRSDASGTQAKFAVSYYDTRLPYNPYMVHDDNCNYVDMGRPVDAVTLSAKFDRDLASLYVQEAAAKIYSSGWDSLTFLAELKKTVGMVLGVAKKLRTLRDQRVVDNWLEARYGWRVLYYDIQDIIKAINRIDDKRKRFSERAGNTFKSSVPCSSTVLNWAGVGLVHETTWTEEWTISTGGRVVADIQPPVFQFNPLKTGWELITYSFVVDWLFGIGTWIDAMSFLVVSSRFFSAGVCKIQYQTIPGNFSISSTGPVSCIAYPSGQSVHQGEFLAREPIPVKLAPFYRVRLDALKVVDLIALILQRK